MSKQLTKHKGIVLGFISGRVPIGYKAVANDETFKDFVTFIRIKDPTKKIK